MDDGIVAELAHLYDSYDFLQHDDFMVAPSLSHMMAGQYSIYSRRARDVLVRVWNKCLVHVDGFRAKYEQQFRFCANHKKCTMQSLLVILHFAEALGNITVVSSGDVRDGFCGIMMFKIIESRSTQFYSMLKDLHKGDQTPKVVRDYLQTLIRQSGLTLVHRNWYQGWRGGAPFVYGGTSQQGRWLPQTASAILASPSLSCLSAPPQDLASPPPASSGCAAASTLPLADTSSAAALWSARAASQP